MGSVLLLATLALADGDPAAGKALFSANCTACHGTSGDGRGPAALALVPAPPDFTAATFQRARTDVQLVASIRAGRPGTTMAAFTQLSEPEVRDIVAYLRTLGKKTPP